MSKSKSLIKENKNMKTKKRKKNKSTIFKTYIYRVLKSINNEFGISKKGMNVIHSIILQIFNDVALESKKLMCYSKKITLSSNDIFSAVILLFPDDIAGFAVEEMKKSLLRYQEII